MDVTQVGKLRDLITKMDSLCVAGFASKHNFLVERSDYGKLCHYAEKAARLFKTQEEPIFRKNIRDLKETLAQASAILDQLLLMEETED